MGRPPIGEQAMTAAERQRRRRAKRRPAFNPDSRAREIMEEVEVRTWNELLSVSRRKIGELEAATEAAQKALIAAMIYEFPRARFVTTHVTEEWESTVTVSVTEKPRRGA